MAKRTVATINDRLLLKPKIMSNIIATNMQARPKVGSAKVSNLLILSNKRSYNQYGLRSRGSVTSPSDF
jgi:hypothetical protein